MPWIALVGPEIEENLSLRYIASSLAARGFASTIVPFNQDADFGPALRAILDAPTPPLAVGVSLAFQWRAADFLAFAVALREQGYRGHITAGGHFATFACRDILRDVTEVDSICRQEAEETMVHLAEALSSVSMGPQAAPNPGALGARLDETKPGATPSCDELFARLQAIPGLALRSPSGEVVLTPHPPLPDLVTLPRPDRRGAPAACFGHGIAPLVSSRGCYANCSFCCIAAWQEQSLPGKRYRLREVDAVADEMVDLQRTRGVDIFVFHDDNFFVPGHKKNRERLSALADALEARKIGRFATVVKARPTDVDPEVFRILRHRLHCIRVYIGVETDADQGLETLRRWSAPKQNRTAMKIVRALDLYTCFNMLIFDPDTTLESLETNIAFMRFAAEYPSNFGRVELYAGTPLLERMLHEGRCRGDYMQWDYSLASDDVERVFRMAMGAFHQRNFGADALNNRIMGTRFDVEVARHFHPRSFSPAWLAEGKDLSRALTNDGCDALAAIVDHVKRGAPVTEDAALVAELLPGLRRTEQRIGEAAKDLARRLQRAVGQGSPLTELGDKVATPLQTQRLAVGL